MENQVSYNTFYYSWHDVMSELTNEQYGRLSRAINDYCFFGIEPKLTGIEKTIFKMAVPNINASKNAKINGKKGGNKAQKQAPLPSPLPEPPIQAPLPSNEDGEDNEDGEENGDVNGNGFTPQSENKPDPDQDPPDPQSFPAANAAEPETAIILRQNSTARSPPAKKGKLELSEKETALFHVAKACFESCEKTKAMLYQDRETTARETKHLKTLVVRCSNIAPEMTADFLRNILEHFRVMTNGKLKGKVAFTPRALITPWIWELVIDSLPENNVTPELQEIIRGLFQ